MIMDILKHMYLCGAGIFAAMSFLSCGRNAEPDFPAGEEISFAGAVNAGALRAGSGFDEDDFVMINSSSDAEFGDIAVCKSVDGVMDAVSVYSAADGVEGRLEYSSGDGQLVWSGHDAGHTFHAWTFPSGDGGGVTMSADNRTAGKAVFGIQKDTGLEQFIVAVEGPVTYADNGNYVRLLFYRPVAKIQLTGLSHIDAMGSITQVEQCTVTFPNLYSSAVFDARRERSMDGDEADVWLREGETGYEAPEKGLVWHWDARDGTDPRDYMLYVCPFEFGQDDGVAEGDQPDELQPGYFTVTAEIGGVTKTYFASLAGLADVDRLDAGQFMKMQLSVQDGAYGGVGCTIVDWNTGQEDNVIHRRPGIYSQEDAMALLDILRTEPVDEDALAEYCDDSRTIRLYSHVDWSSLVGELVVPDGYCIDAQGYRIILSAGGTLSGNVINVSE